jgi:RNA polymerase sigma factor (sigma-70 family)
VLHKTIIMQAQRGDPQAFQQIVEAYHGVIWRTVRILLRDAALTEDIIQETWIDAWRGLPHLQHPQALRSWLLIVVANRCRIASHRPVLVTTPLEEDSEALFVSYDREDTLDQIVRLENAADLHTALETLSDEQQRVLELRYFADLELSEIALVTEVPLGTVKSRLHRALRTLRATLQAKKEKLVL